MNTAHDDHQNCREHERKLHCPGAGVIANYFCNGAAKGDHCILIVPEALMLAGSREPMVTAEASGV